MLLNAAIPVLCILWVLLCLRFYTLISHENVWQRRFIAIGAGLGAGLIYLLGSMLMPWLKMPDNPLEAPVKQSENVRVKGK
ncbi:MAG TPA: hypothetical protein DIT64_10480 [Verrucomicrobiales bacterium]|nr:hypothetical protein [Verrucomicrobiales bacterium]